MNEVFLKSLHGQEPVIVEGLFNAPLDQVYRAWTMADELVKWFGAHPNSLESAEIDLCQGGHYQLNFPQSSSEKNYIEGEYLEIEKNAKLVFTWSHVSEQENGNKNVTSPSLVTVTFSPEGKATRLHLLHEKITSDQGRQGVGTGWTASFNSLRAILG